MGYVPECCADSQKSNLWPGVNDFNQFAFKTSCGLKLTNTTTRPTRPPDTFCNYNSLHVAYGNAQHNVFI